MKRKFGLMFAMIVTLAVMWFSTTGAAWASPASGTVPPGTGPYRVFVATSNGTAEHATYSLFVPTGKIPVGLKFLLKGASVSLYTAKWKPTTGKVVVCGLTTQKGQIYKRSGTKPAFKWTALPSSKSGKMVCALSTPGNFVVVGK